MVLLVLKKLWAPLLLMLVISIIFSCLFWLWIGRPFNLHFGHLNIDFFYTFCGTVTVVGFTIAIYQIAELRTEQQLKNETKQEVEIKYFKDEAILQIGKLTPSLHLLHRSFNEQEEFSQLSIYQYITTVNNIGYSIDSLANHQNSIHCGNIIDCENLVSLKDEIISDLFKIIEEKKYRTIKKQGISYKISELISKTSECERKLRT